MTGTTDTASQSVSRRASRPIALPAVANRPTSAAPGGGDKQPSADACRGQQQPDIVSACQSPGGGRPQCGGRSHHPSADGNHCQPQTIAVSTCQPWWAAATNRASSAVGNRGQHLPAIVGSRHQPSIVSHRRSRSASTGHRPRRHEPPLLAAGDRGQHLPAIMGSPVANRPSLATGDRGWQVPAIVRAVTDRGC